MKVELEIKVLIGFPKIQEKKPELITFCFAKNTIREIEAVNEHIISILLIV